MNKTVPSILIIPLLLTLVLSILKYNFHYLVFHEFAEYFSVFVSFGITLVAYNTYSFTKNRYLLFIGLGYFWIAILDMLHTQTYPGLNVYEIESANTTLTFWVLTRLFEALILLSAPFMRNIKFNSLGVTILFGTIAFGITTLAMNMPLNLFVVGEGLTSLKISFEYLVILILLATIYINRLYINEFNKKVNTGVMLSVIFTILSELSFTLYTDMYGVMNFAGHILKFLSFWILLHTIIKTSLSEPLSIIQKGTSTYNAIPVPTIVVDNKGIIRQANQAACEFVGKEESDLIDQSNHDLFHPKFLTTETCFICKSIRANQSLKEYQVKCPDRHQYIEYSLSPINDSQDGYQGVVQISIDTTKSRKLQDDVINQNQLLNGIINTVPIRIFWKDVYGNYMGANNLFLKDAQLDTQEDIIGKNDFDMIWKDSEASLYREADLRVMNSYKPKLQFEETQTDAYGNQIVLLTSKVPFKNSDGEIIGVLGTYEDITSKKTMENKLLQQSKMAQMGEMISMIAHQWRQPLGAISTTTINLKLKLELDTFDLESQNGVERAKDYFIERLDNIEMYVQNLTHTIDDFRNFYKPNKRSRQVQLRNVIKKSLSVIISSLENDNIQIIEEYKDENSIKIYDSEVMQVVLNLLKNSQDNFKEQQIENKQIKIMTTDNGFSICDNGGGISEDIIDNIFDPYFSTKDEKNGTGLGLYMSKTIIREHHHGKLLAINTKDGVCFKIELQSQDL